MLIGHRLARWLRLPFIIDMRDPWTYGSLWRPKTPQIAAAERALAGRTLGAADRVIFTSPLTQRAMAAHALHDRARTRRVQPLLFGHGVTPSPATTHPPVIA